jgi:hypothetical protein
VPHTAKRNLPGKEDESLARRKSHGKKSVKRARKGHSRKSLGMEHLKKAVKKHHRGRKRTAKRGRKRK